MNFRKWTALAAVLCLVLCLGACGGMAGVSGAGSAGSTTEPTTATTAAPTAQELRDMAKAAVDKLMAQDGIDFSAKILMKIDANGTSMTQAINLSAALVKNGDSYEGRLETAVNFMGESQTTVEWHKDGVTYTDDGTSKTYAPDDSEDDDDEELGQLLKTPLPDSLFDTAELKREDGKQTLTLFFRAADLKTWLQSAGIDAADLDDLAVDTASTEAAECELVIREDGNLESGRIRIPFLRMEAGDGDNNALTVELTVEATVQNPGEPVTVDWPDFGEFTLEEDEGGFTDEEIELLNTVLATLYDDEGMPVGNAEELYEVLCGQYGQDAVDWAISVLTDSGEEA